MRKTRPEHYGAAVFGLNDVYAKLKHFRTWLQSTYTHETKPKLYVVKADICKSFDSINQQQLLHVLSKIIQEVCMVIVYLK